MLMGILGALHRARRRIIQAVSKPSKMSTRGFRVFNDETRRRFVQALVSQASRSLGVYERVTGRRLGSNDLSRIRTYASQYYDYLENVSQPTFKNAQQRRLTRQDFINDVMGWLHGTVLYRRAR